MNWLDRKMDIPTMTEDERKAFLAQKIMDWRDQSLPKREPAEAPIDEMALKREVLKKMAGPDYSELDIGEQESPDIVDPTIENNQVSDDKLEMIRKILQSQRK